MTRTLDFHNSIARFWKADLLALWFLASRSNARSADEDGGAGCGTLLIQGNMNALPWQACWSKWRWEAVWRAWLSLKRDSLSGGQQVPDLLMRTGRWCHCCHSWEAKPSKQKCGVACDAREQSTSWEACFIRKWEQRHAHDGTDSVVTLS